MTAELLQQLQNENASIKSQLDIANSRIASAHQTLVEMINSGLELRSNNILLTNKSQQMQQETMTALKTKQTAIDTLQAQLVEEKAKNAALMSPKDAPQLAAPSEQVNESVVPAEEVNEPVVPAEEVGENIQGN